MANQTESTMQWKLDIQNLKANIQQAQRTIKVANSEFKATTSTMENWSKETTGLEAKLKQLDTTLNSQQTVLAELEKEYTITVEKMGKGSKAAQDLEVKINNQKATVAKTENSIKTYNTKLEDLKQSNADAESSVGKLNAEMQKQGKELTSLKSEYQKVALEQGKESQSAKELEGKIAKLSSELQQNKDKLNDASYATEDLSKSMEKADKSTEKAEGGFTILKGALASLLAEGIKKVAEGLKDLVTESDNAGTSFQAMTGASTDSMKKYNKEMQELYKGNYGESLDDIAHAMAEVKNQTNEVDPTRLKDLTKNAIALRDTFDFDIKESMRAVNMLMKQFGLTSEQAFNLIVQGAQNGLDKNGDLLDTINEYGVHYKQLGYTSEQFFNSLMNGAKSGTFSIDKLGDAVKEFGIRTKDTATTTDEGFQLIGLNADKMRSSFVKGGDSARKATQQTLEALFGLNDQVKRNQAGVDLFGTMWEDLGIEGVKALMNVNGTASKTKASMQELDSVKYSNLQAQFTEIGRTIKTDLFMPMAQQALPKLKEFSNQLKNSSEIKGFMKDVSKLGGSIIELGADALPLVISGTKLFADGVKFAEKNSKILIPAVTSLGVLYGVYKTQVLASAIASETATAKTIVQKGAVMAYNTIMGITNGTITAQIALEKALAVAKAATPWGLAALAIGGVVTAIVALGNAEDDETKKAKERAKQSEEELKSWKDTQKAKEKAMEASVSEIDYTKRLRDELATLVDENGKVKKGYEGRVQYILNELNGATDLEIKLNNGVIESYKEQMKTIDELMQKKRAKAIIDAGEESFNEAIKNQTKAWNEVAKAKEAYTSKEKEWAKEESDMRKRGIDEIMIQNDKNIFFQSKEVKALKETYTNKKKLAEGYTNTIAQQEYLNKLYTQGSAKDIAKINEYVAQSYDDKGKKVVLSTQQQIDNERSLLTYMKDQYKATGDEMYKDQIDASQKRLDQLNIDLANQKSTLDSGTIGNKEAWTNYTQAGVDGVYGKAADFNEVGKLLIGTLGDGVDSASVKGVGAVSRVGDNMLATINGKSYAFDSTGKFLGSTAGIAIGTGLDNSKPYSLNATTRLRNGVLETYANGKWSKAGSDSVYEIAKGTEINGTKTKEKMRILANGTAQEWTGKNWQTVGKSATDGLSLGIDLGNGTVTTSFGTVASNALSAFKRIFKIKSPSRVMKEMGAFITGGLSMGLDETSKAPEKSMTNMANNMLSKMKTVTSGVRDSLNIAGGSLGASVQFSKNATSNVLSTPSNASKEPTVINFNQNNTSPKALSSLEIYRKTNTLLFRAKRGLNNV